MSKLVVSDSLHDPVDWTWPPALLCHMGHKAGSLRWAATPLTGIFPAQRDPNLLPCGTTHKTPPGVIAMVDTGSSEEAHVLDA